MDIYICEYDYVFVVVGVNCDDLVQDFCQVVEKVIVDGIMLEEFCCDFDCIVVKYGWSYWGGCNWCS